MHVVMNLGRTLQEVAACHSLSVVLMSVIEIRCGYIVDIELLKALPKQSRARNPMKEEAKSGLDACNKDGAQPESTRCEDDQGIVSARARMKLSTVAVL